VLPQSIFPVFYADKLVANPLQEGAHTASLFGGRKGGKPKKEAKKPGKKGQAEQARKPERKLLGADDPWSANYNHDN
jgi:hypothetical protein